MEEATKKRIDEVFDIANRLTNLLNEIPDDDTASIAALAITMQGPFIMMKSKMELAVRCGKKNEENKTQEQENTGKAD